MEGLEFTSEYKHKHKHKGSTRTTITKNPQNEECTENKDMEAMIIKGY